MKVRKSFRMCLNMLLKNIQINSLNLLSFVYIVVFDVETALDNIKLAILE